MLMIAVTLLSSLIVTVGINPTAGYIGLVRSGYGPAFGFGPIQPYEPVGPFVDGILYPQFIPTSADQWTALKSGALDLYDSALSINQLIEYQNNNCVYAPDAPGGIPPCPLGQAPIQHEIAIQNVVALDKWEIDFETQLFPTNVYAVRAAIAWIIDKENFTQNFLGGLGSTLYSTVPTALAGDCSGGEWVDPALNPACPEMSGMTISAACGSGTATGPYGRGLPISTRICVANSILDAAGFTVGASSYRENHRNTCSSDPGGCGAFLKPLFFVRRSDPNRLALARFVKNTMSGTGSAGLSIQMVAGCTFTSYPSVQNYCEGPRLIEFQILQSVQDYNIFVGGWELSRDPTFFNIYDPLGIFPGGTNYNRYDDPVFTQAERGLSDAPTLSQAITYAHAAEIEYNASIPVVDVWSTTAPYAYRLYHADSDPVLNGLQWKGIQLLKGTGWNNGFTFLNAQLIGAPVHDPNHQLYIKYGIKTDVLDSPSPIESQFLYDQETYLTSYDLLNALANDDLSFNGDLPWMASLPITTNIAQGAAFPDGSTCDSDVPVASPQIIPRGCSVQTIQLRPDLSFAAALDGSIPSIPVTPDDVVFSTLLARDSPTSFIRGSYFDLQNVLDHNSNPAVVTNLNAVVFEFRTQSVFNRHYIGGTPVESQQHWCVEAHMGGGLDNSPPWPGTGAPSVDCRPMSSCVLSGTLFAQGTFTCPWPKAPTGCTTCLWPDAGVAVTSSGTQNSSNQTAFVPGKPVGIDLGSFAFVYDSQNSFTSGTNGPMLFRTRQTPGMPLPQPYTANAPNDGYFTNVGGPTFTINGIGAGWYKFHQAGNVNWYCTACVGGTSETGPLPTPDMVVNIVDLSLVAAHFGQSPGLVGPYGHAPWDLSGPSGTPDGTINIFDLTRIALHFGQSFLGGTDIGGGAEGSIPGWVSETIPGT